MLKVSEYFTSTTLQHNGFVGRGEIFSAKGFLLGSDLFFVFKPFLRCRQNVNVIQKKCVTHIDSLLLSEKKNNVRLPSPTCSGCHECLRHLKLLLTDKYAIIQKFYLQVNCLSLCEKLRFFFVSMNIILLIFVCA